MNAELSGVPARSGRLLVARLLPGADLVPALTAFCAETGVRAGAVLTLVGSLRQATYLYVVAAPDGPNGMAYTDPTVLPGPVELITGQGTIGCSEAGGVVLHLHGAFCDSSRQVHGGHLAPAGNIVAATVEAVILEAEGLSLTRRYDTETGFPLFFPARA
ncbi:MAG: uncharacterized protein PWR31_1397 [Bacillota bacterium]|jgi:hypothetical protein|nr:uncharacterized protein [Bacillota bacterium]